MNRLYRCGVVFSCLLGSSLSLSVSAQQTPAAPAQPPAQQTPAPQQDAHRIILDVFVTDKSGHPVRGLQQQDFTLLDNKAPTPITGFAAIDSAGQTEIPGETILLLDEVNTTFTQISRARDEVQRFLRQSHDPLPQPVALAFLTDTGIQLSTRPSRSISELTAQLQAHDAQLRDIRRSAGFYGAVERFQISVRALRGIAEHEATLPARKTLVWISPGWPLLTGPHIDLTNKEEEGLFNSLVDLTGALRQARITLYTVDPLGTADAASLRSFYYENFLKGVESPRQVEAGNLALQVLAVHTGGRVLSGSNDMASEIAACVADSTAWYAMSFHAAADDDPPHRWHDLQVKINRPDLKIRTTAGYYTQP